MRNIYKNGGVTLISLIVIIIVMLILAGVSISAIIGANNDSVIEEAVEVKNSSDEAEIKEQIWAELLNLSDDGTYTLDEIAEAAKTVTGNDIDIASKTVMSPNGNEVDLSDMFDEIEITVYADDEI